MTMFSDGMRRRWMMGEGKYLVVKGTSGLGNRLLSLTSGILYARITGRDLVVDWGGGRYPGDPDSCFYCLFECPDALTLGGGSLDPDMSVAPAAWKGHLDQQYGVMKRRGVDDLSIDLSRTDYEEDVVVFGNYTQMTASIRAHLRGEWSRYAELDNVQLMSRILRTSVRPRPHLARRVSGFRSDHLRGRVIGVHVRHSDMKIEVDQYFPIIDRLLKWRKADIFLSTDNRAVEDMFKQRYDRVIVRDKWLPEPGNKVHLNPECPDVSRAEEDAAIDMFLLAGCRYLVFSPKSSFGLVASLFSISPRYRRIAVEKGIEFRAVHWLKAVRDKYMEMR
ncbi:MAG: hypothetical protein GF392_04645 [Candidatus Omnitrophica bacterium]|nr:hypothetical protein [Candidatus Omnitrophota bacterium]